MNNLKKSIKTFFETSNQRIQLQKMYLFSTFFSFALACVINLLDTEFGRITLLVSVASAVAFIANATVWTLGSALISNYLSEKSSQKSTSKSKK